MIEIAYPTLVEQLTSRIISLIWVNRLIGNKQCDKTRSCWTGSAQQVHEIARSPKSEDQGY